MRWIHMKKYICDICGYIYDPEIGDVDSNIKPGVKFEDLPCNWICPICHFEKENFSLLL